MGEVYSVSQTYDVHSRVDTVIYPESPDHPFGLGVTNHYTVDGDLSTVRDLDTNSLYWRAEVQNAQGQLTQSELGNGVRTYTGFDSQTGLINTIETRSSLGQAGMDNDIQDYQYAFDTLGNLSQRIKRKWVSGVIDTVYTEDSQYDAIGRRSCASMRYNGLAVH